MAAILTHPPPPPPPLPSLRRSSLYYLNKFLLTESSSRKILSFCTSASQRVPVPSTAEESSSLSEVPISLELDSVDRIDGSLDFRGCKTCGRREIEKGCNGEGRIQGGIATVPGFGWWPIKAFRPCPGLVASGGMYRRRGQSMDEFAFGRTERDNSVKPKAESSKKAQGPRKLKG